MYIMVLLIIIIQSNRPVSF